jgi:hypothetical protein
VRRCWGCKWVQSLWKVSQLVQLAGTGRWGECQNSFLSLPSARDMGPFFQAQNIFVSYRLALFRSEWSTYFASTSPRSNDSFLCSWFLMIPTISLHCCFRDNWKIMSVSLPFCCQVQRSVM